MNANTTPPNFDVNLANLDGDGRNDLKNWMSDVFDEMPWNTWTQNEIILDGKSVTIGFSGGSGYVIETDEGQRLVDAVDSADLAGAVIDMIEHPAIQHCDE